MRLDLNLLEIFCCVVEEGGFSKAAEKLRRSQPTISGHIRNLENFVGTKLLDRFPRQIVLTHAGKLLYRYGQSILREKGSAERELKQLLNREAGEIILCGSTIPAEYLLPPIVASFHKKFPNIRVEIRISDSKEACADVSQNRAELGFVGAIFEAEEIEFRLFGSDELALVVPNTAEWRNVMSISLDALAEKPFLARETGSGTRKALEKMLGYSLDRFNIVGCFGSTGAIKEAVKANIGVSVLSVLAVATEVASGLLKIVKIEDMESMRRDFYVVSNKKMSLSPGAEAFLRYVLPEAENPQKKSPKSS
jgi:LysR family transcriptional regulator, transcriptional activator of the cysJI operon